MRPVLQTSLPIKTFLICRALCVAEKISLASGK